MLFSRDDVATFVNQNFEAAWESVRPVPTVTIDFGNGTVLTRTLHGNIASYVCSSEGKVLDVIPGIYTPDMYVQRLNELRLLATYLKRMTPERMGAFVKEYHEKQAAVTHVARLQRRLDVGKSVGVEAPVIALVDVRAAQPVAAAAPRAPQAAAPAPAPAAAAVRRLKDRGKGTIEVPVKTIIAAMPVPNGVPIKPTPAPAPSPDGLTVPEDLATWKLLREDTVANEAVRRRQIHALLAKSGTVQPGDITKPIYRDVLHADLDDPYMGLGPTLFGTYPFSKEEKAAHAQN